MKVVFPINHPAHYHLLKNVMSNLKKDGHEIYIIARKKDVLQELLKNEEHYLMPVERGNNIWQKLRKMKDAQKQTIAYVKKVKPDLLAGTGDFSFITKKVGIPTIFLAEDDANLNIPIFLGALLIYGNFSEILSPISCDNSIWNKKTTKYHGFQKLAYLHPNYFTPDKQVVAKYFPHNNPYFLIRFAQLNAYHDFGKQGITTEIAQHLIDLLGPFGAIYITAERDLEPQFEKYRLKIDPLDIHHIMAFSKLYIGDSQSMAVEAAMLGIPSIRFNDFAGKIGVLEELECKYGLTFGIKTSEPNKMYTKIEELLSIPNLREVFQARREKMLSEKIDVTAFFTWFIENYPESKKMMIDNPNYQYNFK